MIRAHQPGSQPLDIPEAIPNPAVPRTVPTPSPRPSGPVKVPTPQRAARAALYHHCGSGDRWRGTLRCHVRV
jgi:hypothetical protein